MDVRTWLIRLLSAALLAAVIGMSLFGLFSAAKKNRETELAQAYESLYRAVMTCYAIEGRYPSSYAYCAEHYGVRIDEEKYKVVYTVFSDNLFPDVTILEIS